MAASVRQREREEVRPARDERACERVKHARIEKRLTRLSFRSCRVCVCGTSVFANLTRLMRVNFKWIKNKISMSGLHMQCMILVSY